MKTNVLKLESFDLADPGSSFQVSVSQQLRNARKQAYEQGFADGAANAADKAQAERSAFAAQVAETLDDLWISQTEAAAHALTQVRPIIEALLDSVIPGLALQALRHQVAALVADALDEAPHQPIEIRVAAENMLAIQAALAPGNDWCRIVADPQIGPLQARIDWSQAAWQVDIDDTVRSCRQCISDFFASGSRSVHRG